jgi:DNA (cytosine-5)-methyltransferase 1
MPSFIAIENVPPFAESRTAKKISAQLIANGYEVALELRCPTELGWPMRRRRCYLLASRQELCPLPPAKLVNQPLSCFIGEDIDNELVVDAEMAQRYQEAIHVIEPEQAVQWETTARCFASAYGTSLTGSGSYLRRSDATVRRFAPQEIVQLLGFPASFSLAACPKLQDAYRLAGNSISVPVAQWVLQRLLGCHDSFAPFCG